MSRPNRIKEGRFGAFTVNGSVQSNTFLDTPTNGFNGAILRIIFEGIQTPGSIWVAESGTDIEIFRKNDFASGDSTTEVYPFVYPVDSTNTTGSPNIGTQRVANSPIYIAGSGLTSGTSTTFGPITVHYR